MGGLFGILAEVFGDILVVDGFVGFDLDEDIVEVGEVVVEAGFDLEEDLAGFVEAHVGVEGDVEVEVDAARHAAVSDVVAGADGVDGFGDAADGVGVEEGGVDDDVEAGAQDAVGGHADEEHDGEGGEDVAGGDAEGDEGHADEDGEAGEGVGEGVVGIALEDHGVVAFGGAALVDADGEAGSDGDEDDGVGGDADTGDGVADGGGEDGAADLDETEKDHDADGEAGGDLDFLVAVGVLGVRGLHREPEGDESDDVGEGVKERVEAVGLEADDIGVVAEGKLEARDGNVDQKGDDEYSPHRTALGIVGGWGGVLRRHGIGRIGSGPVVVDAGHPHLEFGEVEEL